MLRHDREPTPGCAIIFGVLLMSLGVATFGTLIIGAMSEIVKYI